MRRLLVTALIPLTAVVLTACSSDSTSSSSPTTRTVVIEETTINEGDDLDADEPAVETTTTTAAAATTHEAEANPEPSGVGSECNTVLTNGDSIEVKSHTSCEFAAAVYKAALVAPYTVTAPDPTVTGIPKANIMVTSPVTGEAYALECRTGSDGRLLQCEGDDDPSGVGIIVENSAGPGYWTRTLDITGY